MSHHVRIDPSTIIDRIKEVNDKVKDGVEHAVNDLDHNTLTSDRPSVQAAFKDPVASGYWRNLPALFGGEDAMKGGKIYDGEMHITFKGAWDQVNEAMYTPVKEFNNAAYVFSPREINLMCGFLTASATTLAKDPAKKAAFDAFATALRGSEATFPEQRQQIEDAIAAVNKAFASSAGAAQARLVGSGTSRYE